VKIWGPTVSTYIWCLHVHLVSHILTHSLTTVCPDWSITYGVSLYNNIALSYDLLINWLLLKLRKLLFVRVKRKSRVDPTALLATGSTVARLLGLRVRIPPEAWMSSLVGVACCHVEKSLRRAGHSSREVLPSVVSVIVKPRLWGPGPLGAVAAWRKKWNLENMQKWRKTNEWNSPTKNTVYHLKPQWSVWDTMNKRWPGISCTYSDINKKLPVLEECYCSHTIPHSLLKQNFHDTDDQVQRSHYGPCEVEITPRLLHAANNKRSTSSGQIFRRAGTHVWRRSDSFEMFFFTALRNVGDWSL